MWSDCCHTVTHNVPIQARKEEEEEEEEEESNLINLKRYAQLAVAWRRRRLEEEEEEEEFITSCNWRGKHNRSLLPEVTEEASTTRCRVAPAQT